MEGYEVLSPSGFVKKADYIIATSDYVYQDVEVQLKGTNAFAVNALELLVQEGGRI